MRLERGEMPLKAYSDLTVLQSIEDQVSAECFDHLLHSRDDRNTQNHEIFSIFTDEFIVNSVATGRIGFGSMVDPIHNGWFKTL